MDWQPIYKAPKSKGKEIWFVAAILDKDGNIELADKGYFEYEEPRTEMIEVDDGVYIEEEFEPEEWVFVSNHGYLDEPTHFMPLK